MPIVPTRVCGMVLAMNFLFYIAFSMTMGFLPACVTTPDETGRDDQLVASQTIMPEAFQAVADDPNAPLKFPGTLLNQRVIARPRAEVRDGPGLQFVVQNQMLRQGDLVIEFYRVGVWSRILSTGMAGTLQGWVHHQVLARTEEELAHVEIEIAHLPTIFTVKVLHQVYEYPSGKKLTTLVPRGRIFRLLRKVGRRNLVWIAETNAVMFLNEGDAK